MSPDFNDDDDDREPVPHADLDNPQSLNLYSYVRNNPLSRTDPDGHMTCNCPPDYTEAANQLGWLIELYLANVRRGFPLLVKQYFGKSAPAVPTTSAPAQSTPADPNGQDQKGKNKITKKIRKQMARRGWTDESIDQTTSHPVHTSPTENLATGNAATAYFNADGSYVVVDNVTEEVVQVSNRLDPNWVPDSRIVSPYKP